MKDKTAEKLGGYGCATIICVAALLCDGISAITLSIAVAAGIAGVSAYSIAKVT